MKPPGSRDAGLASSRRSKVDETPRPLTLGSPVASKTPRRRSEIGLKALQIDSKTNYERKYGNLPESLARSRTEFSDVITPMPFRAPSIPSEEESPRLPRRSFLEQHRVSEGEVTDVPRSSASESYAFVPTPSSEEENPMFRPDPALFNIRKLTESMKSRRGRGKALGEALIVLFEENERAQSFPSTITETRDNVGIKRFKFVPDYTNHLTLAMQLVSDTLNDYLQAAGKTRTFSFGRSSHYEMEFTSLVYRHWATRLILESFEQRLLGRIRLAQKAIEAFILESEFKPGTGPPRIASPAFSTSTAFANDMQGIIRRDLETAKGNSPQAEDQTWAQQLHQESNVAFSAMVAAAALSISQNASFAGLGNFATEPLAEQTQRRAEVQAASSITPAFAELEISNPQPLRQDETTREFLNEWTASQQREPLKVPPRTMSAQPIRYLPEEFATLSQTYERARSVPGAQVSQAPLLPVTSNRATKPTNNAFDKQWDYLASSNAQWSSNHAPPRELDYTHAPAQGQQAPPPDSAPYSDHPSEPNAKGRRGQ